GLDCLHGGFAILHFDAEMVDAGADAGELGLRLVLAVIGHQGEIDRTFRHVPGRVAACMPGLELVDAKNVFIEPGRFLEVFDLDRNVNDAGHDRTPSGMRAYRGAVAAAGETAMGRLRFRYCPGCHSTEWARRPGKAEMSTIRFSDGSRMVTRR